MFRVFFYRHLLKVPKIYSTAARRQEGFEEGRFQFMSFYARVGVLNLCFDCKNRVCAVLQLKFRSREAS